jgi:hypothetical protein
MFFCAGASKHCVWTLRVLLWSAPLSVLWPNGCIDGPHRYMDMDKNDIELQGMHSVHDSLFQ